MKKFLSILLRWFELFFKNVTFTMPSGLAKGLKRRYGFGFKFKSALTKEEQFLQSLDLAGKTVYDIGGYVGILTLFFARAVGSSGRVFTFEPNPRNFEELNHNIELNAFTNIKTFNVGFGAEEGVLDMIVDPVYPSRSTIKIERAVAPQISKIIPVQIYPLDGFSRQHPLPVPDFVKIDAEGAELEILEGMQNLLTRHKPLLFIEVHGLLSVELVDMLLNYGYTLHHVEAETSIAEVDNLPTLENGHLFCR